MRSVLSLSFARCAIAGMLVVTTTSCAKFVEVPGSDSSSDGGPVLLPDASSDGGPVLLPDASSDGGPVLEPDASIDAGVDPVSGWSPVPPMSVGRVLATATRLPNGKVLVAGGTVYSEYSAQLYDPEGNAWSPAAPMHTTRIGHRAILLPNGSVLVVGGGGENDSVDAEVYDPAQDRWAPTGPMVTRRSVDVGSATLLANGKVLVAGGLALTGSGGTVITRDAEVYDPATNVWSPVASMGRARSAHAATLLTTGEVLVTGGCDPSFRSTTSPCGVVTTTERYDPTMDKWVPAAEMHGPRSAHQAGRLPGGAVIVVGGGDATTTIASTEIYDPTKDAWSAGPDLSAPRSNHTLTPLPSGGLLVVGGGDLTTRVTAERYDPTTNAWTLVEPLSVGRSEHAAELLANGDVLVVGGIGRTLAELDGLTSAERYHPPPAP